FLWGAVVPVLRAQNIPAVTLGPKLGINSSVLYTDIDAYKEDETLGYKAGLFFRLANRSRIYLQPEAYFDLKGGNFTYTIDDNDPYTPSPSPIKDARLKVRLKTVDFPLLIGLKVLDLYGFNFRLMAGPVGSYVLEEKATLEADGMDDQPELPSDLYGDAIWSFQAGGGMDILMFTVDFRYEFGLNNISAVQSTKTHTYLYNLSIGLKLF
ncbi:MAG TPA: porin family protein, partial [Bacteroidales bacterium]|nr:porin family protein [Bacteroidales bacterium]